MKIEIDTDELVEFFGEGWFSCDISTKDELRSFLADFCRWKIEGEEEKASLKNLVGFRVPDVLPVRAVDEF